MKTITSTLAALSQNIEPHIISLRRDIHAHPELSLKEVRTTALVCTELEKLDIPFTLLKNHCVVGILKGDQPGKRIAIRADMDALPITEENDVPYKSQYPGVMHACGHDGHTAMLLGTAALLNKIKKHLHGTVFFCFQSGEEVGEGADVILEFLEAQGGVDQAIAAHLWADIPSGMISVVAGARMAAVDAFDIEVIGKGGHASRPDLCIDPLKPAAAMLLALSSIPTNRYSPLEPLVIHIGKMEGGALRNIFPNSANLYGGIRYFSPQSRVLAGKLINEIAENCARMYGAKARVTFLYGAPAVVNHPEAVSLAEQVVAEMPELQLNTFEPICASENFGFYLEKYHGFMAFIGIQNAGKGLTCAHHHPHFDIDESVLIKGSEFFAHYTARFLSGD